MLVTGDSSKARYCVVFVVRCAGGYDVEAQVHYTKTRKETDHITQEFYNRAAQLRRHICSSQFLFGGKYPAYSTEWVICHTSFVTVYDLRNKTIISEDQVIHPYLEKICGLVE